MLYVSAQARCFRFVGGYIATTITVPMARSFHPQPTDYRPFLPTGPKISKAKVLCPILLNFGYLSYLGSPLGASCFPRLSVYVS